MTSPDWTPYVDLTIYDQDATDIFDEAIEHARSRLPEWIPTAGNIEVVLMEAIATEASSIVAAINRLPGATTETLLKLLDVERSDGALATTTLAITTINTAGYTIGSGTSFGYFPPGENAALVYETTADLIIPNGSSSGTVAAQAQAVGTAYNAPTAGDSLQILETVTYLESASFSTAPTGGAGPETDEEFFTRAVNTLESYSAAMSTADQIAAYVLTTYPTLAYRCEVYESSIASDRDTTATGYIENNYPGRLLVVVARSSSDPSDITDIPLDVTDLQTIEDDLATKVNSSLVIDVVNAELVDVAVEVTVKKDAGIEDQTVSDNIETALDEYLSPNNWEWDNTVRVNELIGMITQVAGVSYVVSIDDIPSLSANASDSGAGTDLSMHLLGSLTYPASGSYVVTVT